MMRVTPVEPCELPEGQHWLFVEVDCELHGLVSREAPAEALLQGWEVAQGLIAECAERRRANGLPKQRGIGRALARLA